MSWFVSKNCAPGLNLFLLWYRWRLVAFVFRTYWRLFYRFHARGRKKLPKSGPLLYVINHQSHYDPPLVGSYVRERPAKFLARSTLFKPRLFGAVLRSLGVVSLRHGIGDKAAMRLAIDELTAGRCMLIFPEGTRCPHGYTERFQPGCMLLVKKTKATVVPVALEGAYDAWPRSQSKPNMRGRIWLQVGDPIPAEDLLAIPREEALERMRRQIEEMRMEMRTQIRKKTNGRYPAPGLADKPYWEQAIDERADAT